MGFFRKPLNFVPQIKSWYFGIFVHLFILQKLNPVSVNKVAKNVVRQCYSQYYSSEVQRQLAAGVGIQDVAVHLILSVLK